MDLGVDRWTAQDWKRQGYIHLVLPRVYAVGHRAPSYESDLAAALLYAGPGAALSHATAAHWLELLDQHPRAIHVSTPRRCRSLPGIVVHGGRRHERIWHKRLPVTALAELFLDLASLASLRNLRHALANADYKNLLDLAAVEAAARRGRRGSARLRKALAEHQPALARTKSRLERGFLELCQSAGIPLPGVNEWVAGWEVDALFHEARIAVELDGYGNHRSRAQIKRDRLKEMALRGAGYTPVRYFEEQVEHQRKEIIADLRRLGVG
jgi:NAD(P)H-dependent FMN reductase